MASSNIPTGTAYTTERIQSGGHGRPSMRGLRSAMGKFAQQQTEDANNITGPGLDPENDPLGINLQARGVATQQAEAAKSDPNFTSGPLVDPKWAGFFQALSDKHVNKVGQDVARPMGLADDPAWQASGDAGALRQDPIGAGNPLMESNNIATPSRITGPLRGLHKARR